MIQKIDGYNLNKIKELIEELYKLSDDDRRKIFVNFCGYCGSTDNQCQCWNEE